MKREAQAGALLFSWFSLHARSESGTARNEFAACPDFITDFDVLRLVFPGDERRRAALILSSSADGPSEGYLSVDLKF